LAIIKKWFIPKTNLGPPTHYADQKRGSYDAVMQKLDRIQDSLNQAIGYDVLKPDGTPTAAAPFKVTQS